MGCVQCHTSTAGFINVKNGGNTMSKLSYVDWSISQ